jgi:HEAT repeat protein
MTFLSKLFRKKKGSQQTATSDEVSVEVSDEASAIIARLGIEDDAINELAELGDLSAIPPLIVLMESGNMRARNAATIALGRLGDHRAVKPLINQLTDEPEAYLRRQAAWALGVLGDRSAVPPLITSLKDDHEDVRHYAAEALGDIGDSRAIEPLRRTLRDKDWVRQAAAQALKNITGEE